MNRMDYTKQPELEIKLPEDREQELLAWANAEEMAPEPQAEETPKTVEVPKPETPKISPEEELRGELRQLLSQYAAEEKAPAPEEAEEVSTEENPQEESIPEDKPEEAQMEASSEDTEETADPEARAQEPLAAVSYESVAQAVEEAQKAPVDSDTREAIDDETLLAELYALIGDPAKDSKPAAAVSRLPEKEGPAVEPPAPETRAPKPMPTLSQEELEAIPEEEEVLLEEDPTGVPGWLKGAFLLLVSLLLSAMTFYAVASDVLGTVF